ncbi:MASE1 domain-containing protein [Propionimicrobium sp. PCR01-08-3]|uniref:MASE1 domain-containing protein n=1 Tax=Propionimicrobium sp. PCR01-08-3 TaxID=3052086 RepID=UPI00255C6EBB|nr:MASE1 domain-containing protein [Propionimicrobium sp. PCR01-08-3]WIY82534.1 MASE1 domain-containing protein [Propionimicrobium sp. PCR01-08-3]
MTSTTASKATPEATATDTKRRESVWAIRPGEVRKSGLNHFVMAALFTGIGIVVGTFGSLAIPLGYITAFWPGQAIQTVGGIWYGGWGGIAGAVFPIISNAIAGSAPLPVSLAYLPGNLAQAIVGGIAFRAFKADPRLKSGRDWMVFTVFGIIVSNLIGAGWGCVVLLMFNLVTPGAFLVTFIGWFLGNSIASWVLGAVMLKFISPIVLKSKAFVKGIWA